MKETNRIYAALVRRAIDIMGDTDMSEYIPDYETVIARVAADIVGEFFVRELLISGGEIRKITGSVTKERDKEDRNLLWWRVPTNSDETEQICRWCPSSYGIFDPGGHLRLCKSCYKEGPPKA